MDLISHPFKDNHFFISDFTLTILELFLFLHKFRDYSSPTASRLDLSYLVRPQRQSGPNCSRSGLITRSPCPKRGVVSAMTLRRSSKCPVIGVKFAYLPKNLTSCPYCSRIYRIFRVYLFLTSCQVLQLLRQGLRKYLEHHFSLCA